jgi:hypothetical protein
MDDDDDVPRIRLWGDSTRRHRAHPDTSRRVQSVTPLADVLERAFPQRLPQKSETVSHEIAMRLVTDDGAAIARADLMIWLDVNSSWQPMSTDEDGIARIDVPDPGPYPLRFTAVPSMPAPGPGPLGHSVLLERQRTDAFHLSAVTKGGAPKTVAIRRPRLTEVLLDGFGLSSVVMRWGGTRPRLDGDAMVTGTCRGALRTALELAQRRHMFVVGHADPDGSDCNAMAAAERARSVFAFLSGQFDLWAEHASLWANQVDFSCALVAFCRITGESVPACDEHGLMGREGMRAACKALHAYGGDASDGFSKPTGTALEWRIIAEAYDLDLARIFGADTLTLSQLRQRIFALGTYHGEVADRFPRAPETLDEASREGLPLTLASRRVAICVFESADAEEFRDAPEGIDVLYDGTFHRTSIDPPAEAQVRIACVDPAGQPVAGARLWIRTRLGVAEHYADAAGIVSFVALRGESIEVVLASDAEHSGNMIDATILERAETP